MATMTIRNIDDQLKTRLRIRAARNGHSMEDEVLAILRAALAGSASGPASLVVAIRQRIEPLKPPEFAGDRPRHQCFV